MGGKYEDILDLPHPEHKGHPKMSMTNRAAQFSPFAALTGFDNVIREAEQRLEPRIQLQEDAQNALNDALMKLRVRPAGVRVRVTYFEGDPLENTGSYRTREVRTSRVDPVREYLLTEDGLRIDFSDLREIVFLDNGDFA